MLFESQLHDLYHMLPWVSTRIEKQKMRTIDTQKRRILRPEQVKEASLQVVERIEAMQRFKDAQTVLVYYPVHNEIDLRQLVQKYASVKTFLFPAVAHHTHKLELRKFVPHTSFLKGRFGIPEPKTEAYQGTIDLMIVPGISFSKTRWRVGRGGGYYDRFMRNYSTVFSMGVCYDFQLHKRVPHWIFDKRVDRVVTPTQTI